MNISSTDYIRDFWLMVAERYTAKAKLYQQQGKTELAIRAAAKALHFALLAS